MLRLYRTLSCGWPGHPIAFHREERRRLAFIFVNGIWYVHAFYICFLRKRQFEPKLPDVEVLHSKLNLSFYKTLLRKKASQSIYKHSQPGRCCSCPRVSCLETRLNDFLSILETTQAFSVWYDGACDGSSEAKAPK